jgi:hypothetical protein
MKPHRAEDREQVRAVNGAAITDARRLTLDARDLALRAITVNLGQLIGDFRVRPGDQSIEPVTSGTAALRAFDPELLKPADQVAECNLRGAWPRR